MSMRFRDLPPALLLNLGIKKAEIAGFAELKDADKVAGALSEIARSEPGYEVLTFAAGLYYVILITPDFVEDTDVTNTNP